MVMLGTKCPSITSTWIQSQPALSIALTSSPSLAKSAERIDGAMMISWVMALSGRFGVLAPLGRAIQHPLTSQKILDLWLLDSPFHRNAKW